MVFQKGNKQALIQVFLRGSKFFEIFFYPQDIVRSNHRSNRGTKRNRRQKSSFPRAIPHLVATYHTKNWVLVAASCIKCMSLNQISYTLPFVLLNRVSFSGFVFVIASASKFLLWIKQLLFQQLETSLSSCLCGLLFFNFCIFRQNSMLVY